MPDTTDTRTAAKLIRQYEKLQSIKSNLIKQGLLTGDATPAQILQALRNLIPQEIFS